MKKLKTLFSITLIIDILATAPLFLMIFIPAMKEEMVYSQFLGMAENELAKEISDLFHFVFTFIAAAMVIAVAASIRIAVLEAAKTAAMLLFIIHSGWVLPDWVNLVMGSAHPPVPIMLLSTIPVIALAYGWKKGKFNEPYSVLVSGLKIALDTKQNNQLPWRSFDWQPFCN